MPDPSPPTDPPALRLTCNTSIADHCAANGCDLTLASAERDRSRCPAAIARCGTTTVITTHGIDVVTFSYYRRGQLVAIVNHPVSAPLLYSCLAGPETLVVPACTAPSQTLPVCGR